MLERVEDAFVDGLRHQQRADGDVAAGERLRDGDEIRLEPPVLEREQLSGPPEARLHLVDREERLIPAAQLLRSFQVAGRRQVDAVALYRLEQEQSHVLAAQLALERVEIAEGNVGEPGQKWTEALDEMRAAVRGERAECQSVETVHGRQHARASRRGAAELERGLDGFRAGARKEDPRQAGGRAP